MRGSTANQRHNHHEQAWVHLPQAPTKNRLETGEAGMLSQQAGDLIFFHIPSISKIGSFQPVSKTIAANTRPTSALRTSEIVSDAGSVSIK